MAGARCRRSSSARRMSAAATTSTISKPPAGSTRFCGLTASTAETAMRFRRRCLADALRPRAGRQCRRSSPGAAKEAAERGAHLSPDARDDDGGRPRPRRAARGDRRRGGQSGARRLPRHRARQPASTCISARWRSGSATRRPTAPSSSTPAGESWRSYDKIHLFDVDLAGGESWRESNAYVGGDAAVLVDLPFARARPRHLLRRALSAALPGLWRCRRRDPHARPPASPARPARRIGTCCSAPAPSRTAPT